MNEKIKTLILLFSIIFVLGIIYWIIGMYQKREQFVSGMRSSYHKGRRQLRNMNSNMMKKAKGALHPVWRATR